MTYSVLFTLLPAGFTPDGKAKLSLVASPRPLPGELGDSEVLHWPDIVAGFGSRLLVLGAGGVAPVEATVVSPRPNAALWSALFSAKTPVKKPTDALAPVLGPVVETQPYTEEVRVVKELYRQVLQTSPTSLMSPGHTVMKQVAELNAWRSSSGGPDVGDLLDPLRLTRDRVRQAATRRGTAGQAAGIVALVPRLRRIGLTSATADAPPPASPPPGPLGVIADPDKADFAQVVGALLRHPALAVMLGLRIDLTMPAFTGQRLIRIGRLDGTVLNGPDPLVQPWSAVVANNGRFVMATEPDERAEIVNGMLDLRPVTGDASRYVVSDVDVTAAGQQLDLLAARIPGAAPGTLGLPPRRTTALTVAQVDRRTRRFQHMLERNARFEGPAPDEVEGAPVLFADDVTTGYRVDVSADRGPFASLMRRVVAYSIGASRNEFSVTDEAQVDAFVPSQQIDNKNQAHVFLGEEIFGWHGWGFGGPVPGPVVGAETGTAPNVVDVADAPLPGFPLRISSTVEPGTLTPLRFGRGYRFRARAVDLAGNSVDPATCDPAFLTAESVYRRYEPVPAPVLVPRRPFGAGESLTQLVVYSDGDGAAIGLPAERHVAAAKTSQRMAELHGAFDAAFGPGATQALRDEMFNLSKREEGSFLDPAPGIGVVGQTQLPVPRGDGLPAGEYVYHDNDTPQLPYLPDVASAGLAITGLPGVSGAAVVPWNPVTQPWPARPPARLVARAAAAGASRTDVVGGRQVVTVDVPPAATLTLSLSSALTPDGLAVMDGPPSGVQQALDGQVPLLSPAQPVTVVHAVRKPRTAPTLSGLVVNTAYPPGTSSVDVSATVVADAVSTSKVALEARWTEVVDRGYGPVRFDDYQVAVASSVISGATTQLTGKHDFGDAKRRVVRFRPLAVTRFAEYFPTASERDLLREGADQVRDVKGRIRPKPPKIHSIVPLVEADRHFDVVQTGAKLFVAAHSPRGVRVYLRRPWCTSGEGELLGVVIAASESAGSDIADIPSYRDKVTRYGTDLLEKPVDVQDHHVVNTDLLGQTTKGPNDPVIAIPGIGIGSDMFAVAGYPVRFDEERNLWFADVLFNPDSPVFKHQAPFVRFGFVAFQPTSWTATGNPGDLRVSAVTVADPVQLPSSRTFTAMLAGPEPTVQVFVKGATDRSLVRIRWQQRAFQPTVWPNPAPDICLDAEGVLPVEAVPNSFDVVSTSIKPMPGLNGATLDALRKGRIVIEEIRTGWSLAFGNGTEERAVFTETIDVQALL